MEIHELLRVLRRRWWLVLLTTALGFAIAAVASFTAAPTYVTSTRVYITVRSTGSEFGLWVGGAYTRRNAGTYENLASSSIVLQPVIRDLHLPYTVDQLESHVTVTATQAEQGVMDIQVTDTSGERAAAIANSIAAQTSAVAETLSSSPSSKGPIVSITQTQPAIAPHHAELPRIPVDLGVGLLAGLLGGLVIGTRLERADTRIRSIDDITATTDVPVLATSPRLTGEHSSAAVVDDLRSLAEGLRYFHADARTGVFLVSATSAIERGGIGVPLSYAAASTLQGAEGRVLHIDADLRGSTAADRHAPIGLADVLAGHTDVDTTIVPSGMDRVDDLPAGTLPPNPSELLQSSRTLPVLDTMRDRYEVVIIDSAPLLPLADAAVLAPLVDGTILVCTAGTTRREELVEAIARVTAAGGHPLGIVVTGITRATTGRRDDTSLTAVPRRTAEPIGARS